MVAALATIKSLHYWNESVFSFKDFSRCLNNTYRDLNGTDEDITPYLQAKQVLDKIDVSHPRVEVAKAHVRQNFRQDISGTLAYLSIEFADMFADATAYKHGHACISTATVNRSVHAKMEDGPMCRPDGTFIFYSIDVTNPHCTFTSQEMSDLGPQGQAYIFQERVKNCNSQGDGGCGVGRGRHGGAGRGRRFDSRHIAAVSNEEVSAVMESTELPPASQDIPTPTSTSAPMIVTTDSSSTKGSTNGNNFGPGAYRK